MTAVSCGCQKNGEIFALPLRQSEQIISVLDGPLAATCSTYKLTL